MPRDPRRTDTAPESLADRVYRSRLSENAPQVRRASRLVAFPATLVGYLVLGLAGWLLFRHASAAPSEAPKSVLLDLADLPEGDAAPAPAPAATPPPGAPLQGAPLQGALEKADAPPLPLPAQPEEVPERPPLELPTQDLSGVAFPSVPGSVPGGTGSDPGPGAGTGPGVGSGHGPKVVDFDYQQMKVLFWPPKPPYPDLARKARVQGTVKVEVIVDVHGIPASVRAVEGPMMLRATSEAYASRMRFQPETENGVPVSARFWLTMPYSLQIQ